MRRQIQCQMSGAAKGALGIQGTRGTVLGGLAQRTNSPVCSASGPLKGTTCCPWFLCPGWLLSTCACWNKTSASSVPGQVPVCSWLCRFVSLLHPRVHMCILVHSSASLSNQLSCAIGTCCKLITYLSRQETPFPVSISANVGL